MIPNPYLDIARTVWGFVRKNLLPILAVIAFCIFTYKVYDWGAEGCRQDFAEAQLKQTKKETKLQEEQQEKNLKVGEETTARVAKGNAKLASDRERADEYLRENPLADGCRLTDDDARMLNSVGNPDGK